MEEQLLNAVRDVKSDKVVRVGGLWSRSPIDCQGSNCRRFINLQYDYTLKKIGTNFIIGLALPRLNRNANTTFINQFNRNMRIKQIDNCDEPDKNGGDQSRPNYSGDPVSRKSLICELYRGLTDQLNNQMEIASEWNFCSIKQNRGRKCDKIDQTEALIDYLSGTISDKVCRALPYVCVVTNVR